METNDIVDRIERICKDLNLLAIDIQKSQNGYAQSVQYSEEFRQDETPRDILKTQFSRQSSLQKENLGEVLSKSRNVRIETGPNGVLLLPNKIILTSSKHALVPSNRSLNNQDMREMDAEEVRLQSAKKAAIHHSTLRETFSGKTLAEVGRQLPENGQGNVSKPPETGIPDTEEPISPSTDMPMEVLISETAVPDVPVDTSFLKEAFTNECMFVLKGDTLVVKMTKSKPNDSKVNNNS